MTLRSVGMRAFRLSLERPLATAHGSMSERRGFLVRLEDSEGRTGLGEATPLPEFGTEGQAESESALSAGARALLVESAESDATELLNIACRRAPNARAALECAIADLDAQRRGVSLSSHWRKIASLPGVPAADVGVQALIAGATPEAVFQSASTARERGYRAFKLKLAVSPESRAIEADLERVVALRESVGNAARIRLDANEAWTRDEAQRALSALEPFGIDFVEQPVGRGDLDGLAWLEKEAAIPVAADEALLGAGLERCLELRAASILIVKPAAIGGIPVAISLVHRARRLGLRIVWSSLIDGAISRQAALHLAAGLSEPREAESEHEDEIHGLGTGPLLAVDFKGAPDIEDGKIRLSGAAGLGLDEAPRSRRVFEGDDSIWDGVARRFESAP
jgi:o-succinylbenzoate synthase